jgi:Putative auto-transporter adhesin, head GIN domain
MMSGGSTLTALGTVNDARFGASGGSSITATEIKAHVASVDVTGGSHVSLFASTLVEGAASGGQHGDGGGRGSSTGIGTSGGSTVAVQ